LPLSNFSAMPYNLKTADVEPLSLLYPSRFDMIA
jgi:hypothetical protein